VRLSDVDVASKDGHDDYHRHGPSEKDSVEVCTFPIDSEVFS
jgi:hypothetical protein